MEAKPALDPVRRVLPPPPARAKLTASATPFPPARLIPLGEHGSEDVVVDAEGRLICGLGDGQIVRVSEGLSETIGDTGGRPLGLEVLADGRVLICDARMGLLRLDPRSGEIETLVSHFDSVPLRFCSNVTAAADGTYWFTESTSRFGFEYYIGAMLEHRPSGRLFRRDTDGHVDLVFGGLHFANGITLVDDESALIFAETDGYRLSRLELVGEKAGKVRVIADNLPGFPDNLSRCAGSRFWVAMAGPRSARLDLAGKLPAWVRKGVWARMKLPQTPTAGTAWAMAFDTEGNIVADLQTSRPDFFAATGAVESSGTLYLAAVDCPALLAVNLSAARAVV